tara:strand:- start:434 stop:682 length:249 start_codon:yes stop_codon:yes gene_type:complete
MKLSPNSKLTIDALKGAIITNKQGYQYKCIDLVLSITNENLLEPVLQVLPCDEENLQGQIGFQLSSLKGWSIQLQPHNKNND